MEENHPALPRDAFMTAWLAGVPDGLVRHLREISSLVAFNDKDLVYAQGVTQGHIWGVAGGSVRVNVAMNEMEPTLGHIHRPGAWLGESEPLLGIPGIVEMRASGETVLERIAYARFRSLANKHPTLWEAFARLVSMNQLLAMSAANDLVLRTGRKRLASALLRLSGHRGVLQGSDTVVEIRVSQEEIAGLANLARSRAANHLGDLAAEQLVKLDYCRITLLDVQALQNVIDE